MSVMAAPVPSSILDQDWRKVLRWGLICGGALIAMCLVGMPVEMDRRAIIERYLSLGYLTVLFIPVLVGWVASTQVVLEGVEARKQGPFDLVTGFVVGAIGGGFLALLMVALDSWNLRDPLVNWSPKLFRFLTYENGMGFGAVAWIVTGAVLGLVGASFHIMPRTVRRVTSFVVFGLISLSILESLIDDLSEGFRLEWLDEFMFAKKGGLTVTSTIVIGAVIGVLSLVTDGRMKAATERYRNMEGVERQKTSIVLFVVIAVLCGVLPMFLGKIMNELLANVGLFLLLALGLNIVVGLAGLLDLGYVAFFAVGGYTTAVLTSPNSPWFAPELHFGIALIFVVIFATITGLVIGAPVIRMRGDYLAIVTLGFGEIIRLLFMSDWLGPYFGGAQGVTNIPGVDLGFATVKGTDPRSVFYLVLFFCAIAIYVSWRLQASRLGRAWMAIREDEQVAEAMGINTVSAKLMAFVVGAVLASFSGAVLAAKVGSVFPTSFMILVSIIILVVVIVGGMGNIAGVMVGSFVLIGVLGGPKQPGLLQEFQNFKLLIYGLLLVFMMLKRPEGLVPSARRSRELHQEEFLQDAWLQDDKLDSDDEVSVGDGGGEEQ
ncbi:MAG: branched-chain amino acid ABC transporter permease [Actinomycetota bacterium]|nr:branched-chain amino acid ABC transporter permease [Actinomycetota bacterium]MEC8872938.1 branched-chain amino acid ABC transporter permease [Actinomycetota bacterium]MEC8970029.1 branched-chain amino acid ABC transporter permease [Actinomycetota bacterium]MEC8982062.1 branched-chain amino acid ABC transporter permease [Actinomycetota bacterium]